MNVGYTVGKYFLLYLQYNIKWISDVIVRQWYIVTINHCMLLYWLICSWLLQYTFKIILFNWNVFAGLLVLYLSTNICITYMYTCIYVYMYMCLTYLSTNIFQYVHVRDFPTTRLYIDICSQLCQIPFKVKVWVLSGPYWRLMMILKYK